jgi:hypothetical protein
VSAINDGGPVYPVTEHFRQHYGLSMRDYFAAAALQGTLASLAGDAALGGFIKAKEADGLSAEAALALGAYEIADAMLKAREAQNAD